MKTTKIKRRSKASKRQPRPKYCATDRPNLLELSALLLFNPIDNIKVYLTKKGIKSADKICKNMAKEPAKVLHRSKKFFANSWNDQNNLCDTAGVSTEQNPIDIEYSFQEFSQLLTPASSLATADLASQQCLCCQVSPANNRLSVDKCTNTEITDSSKQDAETTRKPSGSKLFSIYTKTNTPAEEHRADNDVNDEQEDPARPEELISSNETLNKWMEFNDKQIE